MTRNDAISSALVDSTALPCHVLAIPAAQGQLTDGLRVLGFEVTPADTNELRDDYVFADTSRQLPFDDGAFDAAVCPEGISDLIDQSSFVSELIRVVRPGGAIVIVAANVQNYPSRLRFLFSGDPRSSKSNNAGAMPFNQLRRLADHFGADVVDVRTDASEKAWLRPLFALCHALGAPWRRGGDAGHEFKNQKAMLYGRTMIATLRVRDT